MENKTFNAYFFDKNGKKIELNPGINKEKHCATCIFIELNRNNGKVFCTKQSVQSNPVGFKYIKSNDKACNIYITKNKIW